MLILYLIKLAEAITMRYEDAYMYLEDAQDEENREKRLPIFLLKIIFSFWSAVDSYFTIHVGIYHDYDEGPYFFRKPDDPRKEKRYVDIQQFYWDLTDYNEELPKLAAQSMIWHYLTLEDGPNFFEVLNELKRYNDRMKEKENQNDTSR